MKIESSPEDFHRRLKKLGFKTYDHYLQGKHWKKFRSRFHRLGFSSQCLVCGSRHYELHHWTYARLGAERLEDVLPLCREHHRAYHDYCKENAVELWDVRRVLAQFDVKGIPELLNTLNCISKPTRTKRKKNPKSNWKTVDKWAPQKGSRKRLPVVSVERALQKFRTKIRNEGYSCQICGEKVFIAGKGRILYDKRGTASTHICELSAIDKWNCLPTERQLVQMAEAIAQKRKRRRPIPK